MAEGVSCYWALCCSLFLHVLERRLRSIFWCIGTSWWSTGGLKFVRFITMLFLSFLRLAGGVFWLWLWLWIGMGRDGSIGYHDDHPLYNYPLLHRRMSNSIFELVSLSSVPFRPER